MSHTESTPPEGVETPAPEATHTEGTEAAAPQPVTSESVAAPAGDAATAAGAADAPESTDAADAAPAAAATVPGPAAAHERAAADCATALKQRFPALFGGPAKPLKLKIQADIQQRAPGVFGKHQLSAFFRRYTGSTAYLIAMTRSPHRFDLDGQESGEVSTEHRQAAHDELARRRANHQAKLEQQEDARRKRAALLRDFETTTLTPANFCALKGIAPQALDALLATARREREERARQAPRPPQGAGPRPRHDERRAPRHGEGPRGERRAPQGGKGAPRQRGNDSSR